jgi:hypothetical protein
VDELDRESLKGVIEKMEQEPERELPPKPPAEEELPEEGETPTDDELLRDERPVPDEEFIDPKKARDDQSIDDTEKPEQPHDDLPEGARAEDYGEDAAEETDPADRGQRRG